MLPQKHLLKEILKLIRKTLYIRIRKSHFIYDKQGLYQSAVSEDTDVYNDYPNNLRFYFGAKKILLKIETRISLTRKTI